MDYQIANKNCILIIDEDFTNRELLKNIFSSQFQFEEAANGEEGLTRIEQHLDKLCAIILDAQLPKMDGIEFLQIINARGITEKIPTFLITSQTDEAPVAAAYALGVMDVVLKPITPVVIQRRVKTVIELFIAREALNEKLQGQAQQLSENAEAMDALHLSTIEALATAIEFRDIESGQHINRIYSMTKYILLHTAFGQGLTEEDIENIAQGAIMHDVGKIAISDVILNKPGKLTKEEFANMKQHTVKGAKLLEKIQQIRQHDSYRYAHDIALHHHERWDGGGYPDGLVGDEISVASQVVSIVDVYDALVSMRVYKNAYSPDVAVNMIKNGECGIFNPKLLESFLEVEPVIRKWYSSDEPDESLQTLMETGGPMDAMHDTDFLAPTDDSAANSVTDIMLLMTAVQNAFDMIISVNLTKNTYYMVDYDRFLTHCVGSDGVFDDLIELGSTTVPLSHRREFHDTFCRANLLNEYYAGKKSVRLEHPQYSDDGVLHWVLTKVLFMEDVHSGDILQITLSQYIDAEYAERENNRKILNDALHLAEQVSNAKVDFLSQVNYNIRTPLNAIMGMTAIIADHLDDKEKIKDCLTEINTSSQYLLNVIGNILDAANIKTD